MKPPYTISKSAASQRRPQTSFRINTMINTEQRMKQAQSAKLSVQKFFMDTIIEEANQDLKNKLMSQKHDELELQLQQFRNNMRIKTQEFNYSYDYENTNHSYQLSATNGFIAMLIQQIQDQKQQLKRMKEEFELLKEQHECDINKFSKLQSQYIVLKNKHFSFNTAKEAFISKYEQFDPNKITQNSERSILPNCSNEVISKMTMLDFISTKDENEALREKVKQLELQLQDIQQTLESFDLVKKENIALKEFMNEIQINTDMSKEYIKDLISSQKSYKNKLAEKENELEQKNQYIKQIQNENNELQQLISDQKQVIYNQGIKVQQFDQMEKKVVSYNDLVESNKLLIQEIDRQTTENNELYLNNKVQQHKLAKLEENNQQSTQRYMYLLKRLSRQLIGISTQQIVELNNRADNIEEKSIEIIQELNNFNQELNNTLLNIT